MGHYWLKPGEGDARWMFDSVDTIKADHAQTGGSFSVVEFAEFEGSGPPAHVHDRFDQGCYVLDGEYTFRVAEETFRASQGAWVFVPRGVPRAWRCDTPSGRMLSVTSPSGFEEFYRQAGRQLTNGDPLPPISEADVEVVGPLAAAYGISIVGPPIGVA